MKRGKIKKVMNKEIDIIKNKVVSPLSDYIKNKSTLHFYKKIAAEIPDDFEYKKEILKTIKEKGLKNKKELIDHIEFETLIDPKCDITKFNKMKRIKEILNEEKRRK